VRLNRCAFEFCKKYGIKNYIEPPSFAQPRKENFDVANHLLLIAFFREFKSANPHSAWAYHKASQTIEDLNESITEICKRKELDKLPGVGKTISKVIEEFFGDAKSERLEKEMNTW
jgi:DNA polymerase/3'-5' exonuclease PolX